MNYFKNTLNLEVQLIYIKKIFYSTNDTNEVSKNEKRIEKAYEIKNIVEKIIGFSQVSYQKGQGLKIKSPDQMVRLPNTLAQLKAWNNSQKIKNQIRRLLHFLYRSKKLTKTIYNNLINTI